MTGTPNAIDAALAAIALISGLLAMYRGLSREVLSILSWIAAAGAVLYFVLYHQSAAEELSRQFNVPVRVAQVVIGGLIFLLVLIIVHLITARISDVILDSRIGMIDRILGLLFGIARGFVIVLIPYMFYLLLVPEKQHHQWVGQSLAVNLVLKPAASRLKGYFERYAPSQSTPQQQQ